MNNNNNNLMSNQEFEETKQGYVIHQDGLMDFNLLGIPDCKREQIFQACFGRPSTNGK